MNNNSFAKTAFYKFVFAAILSSLGITVSTFADSVIIGNVVGELGLASANIVSPIFLVLNMLGFTVAIGAGIFISRDLGKCEVEAACKRFTDAVLLSGILCLAVYVAILLCYTNIYTVLGATPQTIDACKQYGDVILICAPIFIISPILSISVRSDAAPYLAAVSAVVVVVANITLDIVFMFGFSMGVRGAAIAICIAEFLGALVCILHFFKRNSLLKLVKFKSNIMRTIEIVQNGFGLGSAYIFQSVIIIFFNNLLGEKFGVSDMAIFGILVTICLFAYAIFDGISLSIAPLVSTYFGEQDTTSIKITMLEVFKLTVCISGLLVLIINLFPQSIIQIFGFTNENSLDMAVKSLIVFSFCIPLMCFNSVAIAYFQSISRIRLATIASIFKNVVFLLLFGAFFISRFGVVGISYTYIAAEVSSFFLFLLGILVVRQKEKIKSFLLIESYASDCCEVILSSDLEAFTLFASDVEQYCENRDVELHKIFFTNLIIEELVSNIIKIGIKDKKIHNIKIKVMVQDSQVNIWIRDDVTAYNPFESIGDSIDNAVINMIKGKAKYYDYQRRLVFNNLYVVI